MPGMIRHALAASLVLLVLPSAVTPQTPRSSSGPTLYQQRCASCHGKDGRGDGEYAGLLNPRPHDFASDRYKFRSTDTGALPTDDDLAHSITEGMHGTSMPAGKSFLSADEGRALVAR